MKNSKKKSQDVLNAKESKNLTEKIRQTVFLLSVKKFKKITLRQL